MYLISRRTAVPATAAVFALLAPLVLGACSSDSDAHAEPVVLTSPTWTGGQANVAVARYLLENELDQKVRTRQMDEKDAWKAVGGGKADAILEDWGHPDLEEKYVFKKKTIVRAGDVGVTGKIGWYVPEYLTEKHPGITDWKKLNDLAPLLRTPKSGNKGQLIEGSPEFLTRDDALIKNLRLNYKTVYTGSEKAQIEEIQERTRKRQPFLTYWWRPHWLASEANLKEVQLPAHYEGCDKNPKTVTCGYPETPLKKYLSADFSKNGGKAAEFLKNFQWGEDDQNAVAKMIAQDGLSPGAAAKKWVKENPGTWKVWLWGLQEK
ncbi:ABC transporter substrate-binding protein [Streptomyces iconiensis]|uniref:ABC transporter substrate-binding protein n=1 Tax=Streptomyces iconiensis TaxID=1384038 RepID=A0ABT7AAE4_9ACTN|nr:ABC transporter substrate-binding protein [Streptomyces iconiensis]MDJ1138300.1 ABC transporter substrate-binding protein [Streptomyces iconiensis]